MSVIIERWNWRKQARFMWQVQSHSTCDLFSLFSFYFSNYNLHFFVCMKLCDSSLGNKPSPVLHVVLIFSFYFFGLFLVSLKEIFLAVVILNISNDRQSDSLNYDIIFLDDYDKWVKNYSINFILNVNGLRCLTVVKKKT